jgi:hypothetical protein
MPRLGIASKLSLHPVAIANLVPHMQEEGSTCMFYAFVLSSMCVLWTRTATSTWSCFNKTFLLLSRPNLGSYSS